MAKEVWKKLSSTVNNVANGSASEQAIVEVLDAVLSKTSAEVTFDVLMLANNSASMYKNTHGSYPVTKNPATSWLYEAMALSDLSMTSTPFGQALNKGELLAMQALMQPNIAGIPISSPKIETNREVEVSEAMVIVQSKALKQYWTDNAVPRLKEWTVDGYLTSISPLDTGHLIKPSIQWQVFYLDVCARSRRPVIFKTNRGEFVKVQITSLHTTEEASYNNGVQVSLTLKEYNPYYIDKVNGDTEVAIYSGVS